MSIGMNRGDVVNITRLLLGRIVIQEALGLGSRH